MRGQPCFSDIGYRLPHMAIWLWLHLLIEDISNQRMPESITEDEINKPWRPISSKRLNPAEAKNILRIGIILAMGLSLSLGNFVPSVTLMAMIWQYNDLDGSNGAWRRNILTAAGLGCFSWGAVVALSTAPLRPENEELLRNWILLSSVVILTTIQVQDFPDTAGDIARGRSTMPLIYGETWSRWMTATFILLWSIVCPRFWQTKTIFASLTPLCIGAFLSASLTIMGRGQRLSEFAWKGWCVWIAVLYLLPLFVAMDL